jgi:PAS domain S-box-containing protein
LIGKRPADVQIDEHTRTVWFRNNRKAFDGETVEGEVLMRLQGEERFYYNVISPMRYDGRACGIVGVNIDITDRKRAEEALQESEEKCRSITEQSPSMIFINKNSKIVYCNKKCEELMGYSQAEFCSHDFDFFDLIFEDSIGSAKSALTKHIEGDEVEPNEYRLVTKGGDKLDALITTKLIQYEGGSAILGIVTDITQRKKFEAALSESESKFRALTELSPAAILIIGEEGILYANPAFESITGFTKKEVRAMQIWDLVHPEMREIIKARGLARQSGERVPSRYEVKIRTQKGREKWIDLAAVVINYGGLPATLATAYDITESKLLKDSLLAREKELESKTHDLEEMNAALRVLLKKRDSDRVELEEKIQFNVKKLIEPFLADLKNTQLSSRQATLLEIIQTNFDEISSPFTPNFSSIKHSLTPQEIKIASLIRRGDTTKKIAELMGLSLRTIEFHRTKIRRKLRLKHKHDSLRGHLQLYSKH